MKKFIAGFTIAALLFGGTAAAASSGLIGQKVTGTLAVERHGKSLTEAVTVQGRAYVPVKSLEQMAGLRYTLADGKISLSDAPNTIEGQINAQKKKIKDLEYGIGNREAGIEKLRAMREGSKAHDPEDRNGFEAAIANVQKELDQNKAELADVQAVLKVLEQLK
ncbi:hypothetical protein QWJ34_17295 [Saccharibacillus sp. CPCC 101409]|uniref:hypothetical protein n=1 Tax=Saccharibacillus sp. CPCC 101409 TaxID=3058041 RepID=UPI002673D1A6|nr:hypothetical protein [Saccharibacillus sp. CPCC 101409]MDO3411524.1 hypothetical protein [Saccharibacillus sp. CPCC 101409]